MSLDSIVNVQITRETQTVSEAGFGTLMILGTFKNFDERIRFYSSMQEVAADFSFVQDIYQAANSVFSQAITPDQIAIGRRQADQATIQVITPMAGKVYGVTIGGVLFQVTAINTNQESVVTLDDDFEANNLIKVVLNGTNVGTITSEIKYSTPFTSGSSTITTINGVAAGPGVDFASTNAGTLTAIAAQIEGVASVDTATSNGTDTITVVFLNPGNNTVNSSVTTGGSAPTATISEGSFEFDTDQETTMNNIAAAMEAMPNIDTVEVLPDGANQNRILKVNADPNFPGVVNSFTVTLGADQPTASIVNSAQDVTNPFIASLLVEQINATSEQVVATDNLDGSFSIENGISTSTVNFNIDFVASNSIVATINGDALSPVVFTMDQPTTMQALATAMSNGTNVDTAIVTGERQITVTYLTSVNNHLDSVVTTGGISQPVGTCLDIPSELPYTLSVRTNIVNATTGLLSVLDSSPNTLYQVTVNGTLIQYTSPNSVQTNEQIAAALTGLINSQTINTGVGATDNLDGSITVSSENGTSTFVLQATPFIMSYQFGMIIEPLTASESVTNSLDAIVDVNDEWYALACTDRTSATVQQIAAWVQARVKIFGTASNDPNIINQAVGMDTTSIAAIFNNNGYTRSFVLYHQDADNDYPECAWFGDCLPLVPGSETWAFKQLTGIAYSDLSTTQANNVWAKKANTYQYVGGVGITQQGTVSSGEYIDIIRGVDWLTSTIQSYVYGVLVNNPKVPYTDQGIATIEAQVKRALNQAVTNQFIAADPAYTVTVPKAANVPTADKAARILRNVIFQATLAGAIQAIRIRGTVSV